MPYASPYTNTINSQTGVVSSEKSSAATQEMLSNQALQSLEQSTDSPNAQSMYNQLDSTFEATKLSVPKAESSYKDSLAALK